MAGKRKRKDIAEFSVHLFNNILSLHQELKDKTYTHGSYQAFRIHDPKPRDIHKASVRDRLLHHAVYRILYPYFDQKFIFDSYSCRKNKGTNRAINRFRAFGRKVSKNNTRICWVLQCDISKFFASIDQKILLNILKKYIDDADCIWFLQSIIESFSINGDHRGLPLGNLTSQLFINIYMNEFDQYIKRVLKIRCYIRYADDFVILHQRKKYLTEFIPRIHLFLEQVLKLSLHSKKVRIISLSAGVDFLGWVHFPCHRVLRTSTKRRMFQKLERRHSYTSIASYRGLLKHGNTHKLLCQLYGRYRDDW